VTLYVLDTDHLSLYGRNHPRVLEQLRRAQAPLTTTAVNVDEQLRGRLAQVSEAKDSIGLSNAYLWLTETMLMLSDFQILQYDEKSGALFQALKAQRIRVGTQDLRIASIVLAHDGVLLTRNLRDFAKVPRLAVQDWSI
jgi:tRNA(fMet)-specific endonuclease VapC